MEGLCYPPFTLLLSISGDKNMIIFISICRFQVAEFGQVTLYVTSDNVSCLKNISIIGHQNAVFSSDKSEMISNFEMVIILSDNKIRRSIDRLLSTAEADGRSRLFDTLTYMIL